LFRFEITLSIGIQLENFFEYLNGYVAVESGYCDTINHSIEAFQRSLSK